MKYRWLKYVLSAIYEKLSVLIEIFILLRLHSSLEPAVSFSDFFFSSQITAHKIHATNKNKLTAWIRW